MLSTLEGLAFIKDSKSWTSNLQLHTVVYLNTKTNTPHSLQYSVTAFTYSSPNYYNKTFKTYDEAANEYDRLAKEFDGHR